MKGATDKQDAGADGVTRFNPRTHEGCDPGMRPKCSASVSFNPRTHEGCDFTDADAAFETLMFQSTHP